MKVRGRPWGWWEPQKIPAKGCWQSLKFESPERGAKVVSESPWHFVTSKGPHWGRKRGLSCTCWTSLQVWQEMKLSWVKRKRKLPVTHRCRALLSKENDGNKSKRCKGGGWVCQIVVSFSVLKVGKDASSWRNMAAWQAVTSPERFS